MNFVKITKPRPDYLYNYLLKSNLIGKYVHILLIKPCTVKYYFVKSDDLTITPQTNDLTILEGFACEKSDLNTKPACLSEDHYNLIPDEYKGHQYNIYYEAVPFTYKVKYINENETQYYYTAFPSERVIHYYTIFTSLEEIQSLFNVEFSSCFVA